MASPADAVVGRAWSSHARPMSTGPVGRGSGVGAAVDLSAEADGPGAASAIELIPGRTRPTASATLAAAANRAPSAESAPPRRTLGPIASTYAARAGDVPRVAAVRAVDSAGGALHPR